MSCGIIFHSHSPVEPSDAEGCILPEGHQGEHQFKSERGRLIAWQYDWECGCDNCCTNDMKDMCILYREIRDDEKI